MRSSIVCVSEDHTDFPSFDDLTKEYLLNKNPNFSFLNETLLSNIRRRSRSDISFFSPRSWRTPIKRLQVAAMRNLKGAPDETTLREIAREVAACASTITNGKPYDFICGVPGGSSSKKENFGSLVARFVADDLNIGYCAPLVTRVAGGRSPSHPKQSMHFRSRFVGHALEGTLGLLIDDVATSGAHFADCVTQLRRHGISVVCVSWIS